MKVRWPILLLLLSIACGESLVDGAYSGEPYVQVSGTFRGHTGEATIHSPHSASFGPRDGPKNAWSPS